MKGNNSKIKFGTIDNDKIIGTEKGKFKFLTNSISSNKLSIIPNEKKTKIVTKNVLKNFSIKYIFIILFILQFFQ